APVHDRHLDDWLPLLYAADSAARRFAMEKLGNKDTHAVAEALLAQVDYPDRALREEALLCLAGLTHGREVLARRLLEADSPDQAWVLARAQAPLAASYDKSLRTRIFNQVCDYLDGSDRRADALLFLLREIDAKDLRDRLEERALALRKKKKYAVALIYL